MVEQLIVDFSMTKTLFDYPVSYLPPILHQRTGKAKNCLCEEIDKNLYDKHARMVAFYTTKERILPWIKTLDVFYYDNLGKEEDIEIKWYDSPEEWKDCNRSSFKR